MKPRATTETRHTVDHEHLLTDPEWAADRAAHRRQLGNAPEIRINQAVKRGPFRPEQLAAHAAKRGRVLLVNGTAWTLDAYNGGTCTISDGAYGRRVAPVEIAVLCGQPPITAGGAA